MASSSLLQILVRRHEVLKTASSVVTGVALNKAELSLVEGDEEQLSIILTPSTATADSIVWTTSNSSVATVTDGLVNAISDGSATITVTVNGTYSATCSVEVAESEVEVTGITLNVNTLSLTVGESQQLTATVTPSNATYNTVIWSTSDSNVATVTNGLVTAVSSGSVIITATTYNGTYSATCSTTVTAASASDKVVLHWTSTDSEASGYIGDYIYNSDDGNYYYDGVTSANYIYNSGTTWGYRYNNGYESYDYFTFTGTSNVNSIVGTNTWNGSYMYSGNTYPITITKDDISADDYDLNLVANNITVSMNYDTWQQETTINSANADYTGLFKIVMKKLKNGYKGSDPYIVYCKDSSPTSSSKAIVISKSGNSFYWIASTYGNVQAFENLGTYTDYSNSNIYQYLSQSCEEYSYYISCTSFSKAIATFRNSSFILSPYDEGMEYSGYQFTISSVAKTSFVMGTITPTSNPIEIVGVAGLEMAEDLASYVTVSNSNTPTFTADDLPVGLDIIDNLLEGTPRYGDTGTYKMTVTADTCDELILSARFNIAGESFSYGNAYVATSNYSLLSGIWEKYTSTTTVDGVTYNTYRHAYSDYGSTYYNYLFYIKDSNTSKNYWVVSYNRPSNSSRNITTDSSFYAYANNIEKKWTMHSNYSSYSISFVKAGTITASNCTVTGEQGTYLSFDLSQYVSSSDGSSMTYSGSLPTGLSITGNTLSGTPTYGNSDEVTITVTSDTCVSTTFVITFDIEGEEEVYNYKAEGCSTAAINGKYSLISGTHGLTDAIYYNGTYYLYYYSSYGGWMVNTTSSSYGSFGSSSITGSWSSMMASGTAPTFTEHTTSSGGGSSSGSGEHLTVSGCSVSAANGNYYLYSGTNTSCNSGWKHETEDYYIWCATNEQYVKPRIYTSSTIPSSSTGYIATLYEVSAGSRGNYNPTTLFAGGLTYGGITTTYHES